MHSTTRLKATFASAVTAALLLLSTPFAVAEHRHDRARSSAAPRSVERMYTAPRGVERAYMTPRRVERTYMTPRRVERAYMTPRRVERTYAAPRPIQRMYGAPRPIKRTYAAPRSVTPQHVRRSITATGRTFVMPVRHEQLVHVRSMPRERFVRSAPAARAHVVRAAPFVQRAQPRRTEVHANTTAPFREVVRIQHPRVTRFTTVRQVVTSPLMRAVFAPRTRRVRVVYHPAYLTGRVIEIRRQIVVLQPPFGQRMFVNAAALPNPVAYLPLNSFVTVPVTYANGMYSVFTPPGYSYNAYGYNAYPYAGYNGYTYPYGTAAYCNGGSSLMYAALLPTVLSAVNGGGSLNVSNLAALALTAVASGSNSCYPGYDPYGAYGTAPVYNGYPGNYNPIYNSYPVGNPNPLYDSYPGYGSYATPYDSCAFGDNDGDEGNCAAQFGGAGYPGYAPYGLQQVQGLVVGRTGSELMVLTGNGMNPVFIDASPAFQNGYSVNGPVAVGQVIDAYGFYSGNTFVATSIV